MKNNQQKKEEYLKLNFFTLIWYSITKFEKYPEMAAMGVKKALIYFTEIMVIFGAIFTFSYIYSTNKNSGGEVNISATILEQILDNYEGTNEQREQFIETFNQSMGNKIIVILFISSFIAIYITTLLDVFTLSVFGLLTCLIAKIKINYKAIFNMSIYAMTLSIILRMIYFTITMFTEFKIKYFDIMYTAVSYIILAAAIFMIKSDLIKQQMQLINFIEETQEKIEQTLTKRPKEDDEEEEKEDDDEESDVKKDTGREQGSNA